MIVCFRYRSLKISLHAKEMAIGKMCVVSPRNCFFLRQQNIIAEKGAVFRNTTPGRKLRDETGNQHCDESSAVIYSPPPPDTEEKMEEVEF